MPEPDEPQEDRLSTDGGRLEALPAGLVEALCDPGAYPHDSSRDPVETIQTHISHIYLTHDRVYKLRKAIVLPFLSFGRRSERNRDCLREVELNRRLAPDVYLGVAPVVPRAGGWSLGPTVESLQYASDQRAAPGAAPAQEGAAYEHCVVMRRLPAGRDALSLLQHSALTPAHIDALAESLARFHAAASLGRPAPFTEAEWLERVERPIRATFELTRGATRAALDPAVIDRAEDRMAEIFLARRARFVSRRSEGRVVDGHGDLHLDHVWFEDDARDPIAIDCIEFDDELRRVDVAAELAFFAMDLIYRDAVPLAERLLSRYAELTGDFGLYGVVDYHVLHRAMVRCSVAAVATGEPEIDADQRRAAAHSAESHLRMVTAWATRTGAPGLIVVGGLVGTGKSTVAQAASELLDAPVISSDRVRKMLAGLRPEQRASAPPGEGIYDEAQTRGAYAGLLERAECVIESGRTAVLDATWARREQRASARRLAQACGVPFLMLEARCADDVALERLARRERDPGRVSDAGPGFFAESRRRFEEISDRDPKDYCAVWTDHEDWRESLRARLDEWRETATGAGARRRPDGMIRAVE